MLGHILSTILPNIAQAHLGSPYYGSFECVFVIGPETEKSRLTSLFSHEFQLKGDFRHNTQVRKLKRSEIDASQLVLLPWFQSSAIADEESIYTWTTSTSAMNSVVSPFAHVDLPSETSSPQASKGTKGGVTSSSKTASRLMSSSDFTLFVATHAQFSFIVIDAISASARLFRLRRPKSRGSLILGFQ